jgi:hypothetical protein
MLNQDDLERLRQELQLEIERTIGAQRALQTPSYSKNDLPPAARFDGWMIYVPDATGGPCLAVSNGTNWLRLNLGAVVS